MQPATLFKNKNGPADREFLLFLTLNGILQSKRFENKLMS